MDELIKRISDFRNTNNLLGGLETLLTEGKQNNFPTYSILILAKLDTRSKNQNTIAEGWIISGLDEKLDQLNKERELIEAERVKLVNTEKNSENRKRKRLLLLLISMLILSGLVYYLIIASNGGATKENELWEEVTSRNTIDAYMEYVNSYPNGTYKALAKMSIAEIEDNTKISQLVSQRWNYINKDISNKRIPNKYVDRIKLVDKSDNFTVVVFKTELDEDIKIKVNGSDIGQIDKNSAQAVRLSPSKNYNYEASFTNSSKDVNDLNSIPGSELIINITETESNTSYLERQLIGLIKGSKVNFRSTPNTANRENIIGQLNDNTKVTVLDKNYRITLRKTSFKPQNGNNPFFVHKGVAVKFLSNRSTMSLVLLTTDKGQQRGFIQNGDLQSMEGSSWYKIKLGNQVGWVYSDFVRIRVN